MGCRQFVARVFIYVVGERPSPVAAVPSACWLSSWPFSLLCGRRCSNRALVNYRRPRRVESPSIEVLLEKGRYLKHEPPNVPALTFDAFAPQSEGRAINRGPKRGSSTNSCEGSPLNEKQLEMRYFLCTSSCSVFMYDPTGHLGRLSSHM